MQLHSLVTPWRPTHIIPLGDIQWAGKDHFSVSLSKLQENITRALEYEKQGDTVLFLGMGDYIDFMSPSNRARLQAADLYDTALDIIDQKALDLTRELFDLALRQTKGRWIGMVEGHHFRQLATGATTDMELCQMLGTTFLGTSAVVRVVFQHGDYKMPALLWVHHGAGGGQTSYYPLARLEKVAADWEGIDIFLMGHTVKQGAMPKNRIRPRFGAKGKPDLTHRSVYLVGTGGYSKCYAEFAMQGRVPRGGYAEKGMMSAAVMGSPIIHLVPQRRHKADGDRSLSLQISVEVW
jgi:hypothetical protein